MTQPSQQRDNLFTVLADGHPMPAEEASGSPEAESLRLLTDVRNVFRDQLQVGKQSDTSQPQFTWGDLRVFEVLGQGGYGTVYRAHDPWLARDVALKLFAADVGHSSQLIEEARQLAGLRHANILLIHGAAVHSGRAGYWSELVRGRTLASLIACDGALSIEESLRIARDLASALNAVHGIDLVHGDIKAENVMRASGGRVVLMDFGASGSVGSLAARLLISGTPRYLAPEVLSGAPMSATSDWYAFGVLVHLMLTGELPFPSLPYAALCEAKRLPPPSLLTKRSDLPPSLATWADALIAVEPDQRPDSSAIMKFLAMSQSGSPSAAGVAQQALSSSATSDRRRRRWPWLGPAIATLIAVAVAAIPFGMRAPEWNADAQFFRVDAGGDHALAGDARLSVNDRFYLRLQSNRPSFVYVLNEDADGIATVLFPSAEDLNPVPAGVALRLPQGGLPGLAWQVTSDSAHEEFVVISAIEALPSLEQELVAWKRAERSSDARGVGAIVPEANAIIGGERLLVALAEASRQSPDTARIWQFRFGTGSNQRQSPEATKPAQ